MRLPLLCWWLGIALPLCAQTPQFAFTNLAGWPGGAGYVDGPSDIAQFNNPNALAEDDAGNIYLADAGNDVIRKLTPEGVVTTLAGQAQVVGSADGQGPAAQFNTPHGLVMGTDGYLYVSDYGNHTIRKISSTGMVTTVAGAAGLSGAFDGAGNKARFYRPDGLARDSQGNIYVADRYNHAIRKLTPDGNVTTVAGVLGSYGKQDGVGGRFNYPGGLAVSDDGSIFVADSGNNCIRLVDPNHKISTFAGLSGSPGQADGVGAEARLNQPGGLVLDGSGTLYVADTFNNAIRVVTADGSVTTLAGSLGVIGSADGFGDTARFHYPKGIVLDPAGSLYVGDVQNDCVRRVSLSGEVTTFAGTPPHPGADDGAGRLAGFNLPFGVAVDPDGNLYVGDSLNQTLRKVTPDGEVTTIAGKAGETGFAEGFGTDARFNVPAGLAVDSQGNLYMADAGNHTIRKMTTDGYVSIFAGFPDVPGSGNGQGVNSRFNSPGDVAIGVTQILYVADTVNHLIRRITADGMVTTLAGSYGPGGLDGDGIQAQFNGPNGVAVGPHGDVYVADTSNHTIRKVTPQGTVTTLAGLAGKQGYADDTGAAARFSLPWGISVDVMDNVYVCERGNHTIRKVSPEGVVTTIAGHAGTSSFTDGLGADARFNRPCALALDRSGNLYVGDTYNNRITKGTFLPALKMAPGGGGLEVTLAAYPGTQCVIESATSLDDPIEWKPLSGDPHAVTRPSEKIVLVSDSTPQGRHFYRVRPLP